METWLIVLLSVLFSPTIVATIFLIVFNFYVIVIFIAFFIMEGFKTLRRIFK
jgi:hypothetical protein